MQVSAKTFIDPDTFNVYWKIDANFRIYFDAQQDGHGPFPTSVELLDKALAEVKTKIMESLKENGYEFPITVVP